jgi:phosphinothricin acetyltransferase
VTDPVVRDADATLDASACAEIYGYFVENSVVSFEYQAPSIDETRARIQTCLKTHEWLVAERAGRVDGFAYASPWNPRPAYDWACETTVYVRSGSEGLGIGTALYGELIGRLRRRGFHLAVGRIALPNPASERLHRSLGFVPVGVHKGLGYKHGRWVDVMHTELALNRSDGAPATVSARLLGE